MVRYMPYLKDILRLPRRESPLEWLHGGSAEPALLSIRGHEHVLHYSAINGNTDAAIITRASRQVRLPQTGLCILFELKKPANMGPAATFQALCQLVLANIHSRNHRPVVCCTDLGKEWILLWLDGSTVKVAAARQPAHALDLLRECMQHAAAEAMGADPLVAAGVSSSSTASGMPSILAARKQCMLAAGGADAGPVAMDMRLADLAGFLPEEELREPHAWALVQQVTRLPAFSMLQHHQRAVPQGMYG